MPSEIKFFEGVTYVKNMLIYNQGVKTKNA